MTSTIKLYFNCLIEKDKNYVLDSNGVNVVEDYLSTLDSKEVLDFQYIKHDLVVSIKIDASQTELNMGSGCDELNYCSITNENQNTFYYFIIQKYWRSQNTLELVLNMDTLNTFQYDKDYEISPKTYIKRQHKDRFKKMETRVARYRVSGVAGETLTFEFTSTDFAYSTPYNISVSGFPNVVSKTINVIKKDGLNYIQVVATNVATRQYSLTFTYSVPAFESIIDLRSEDINVPVYKKEDTLFVEKEPSKQIDWLLYYKTADDQSVTPIDCYLIPGNPINFALQNNDGSFTSSNVPSNRTLLFFYDYNNPSISINVDGVQYTPSIQERNNQIILEAIAISNVNGTLEVYFGSMTNYYNQGRWSKIASAPSILRVENSPRYVYSYEVSSLPSVEDIFTNRYYEEYFATYQIDMGATTTTFLYGNNKIDKTLSTNVKIINIPYSPTSFTTDEDGVVTFDTCWTYSANDEKMKLTDFNVRFINTIETSIPSLMNLFIINHEDIDLHEDIERTFIDPKLKHSDYYRPKFVYDSFGKIFHLENVNYGASSKDLDFKFDFVMSRNIVSKFLFKFNQIKYNTSVEDYDDIVSVSRNNEEVLYNSQYLNYIRTGYNYDLKAKERNEATSGVAFGLNVASFLASVGVGLGTGNPIAVGSAVVSGIGLASQLGNIIKSNVQNEENIQRKLQEAKLEAVSVQNADDYDLLYAYSQNKAKYCLYECSDRMKKVLDDLFFYCGYVVNEQGKPNITSRRSFNFIQASLVITHTNNLSSSIQDDIKEKFEQGVTFLHKSFNKFDFEQDKENIELSVF